MIFYGLHLLMINQLENILNNSIDYDYILNWKYTSR